MTVSPKTPFRVATGGRINRSRVIRFRFNGEEFLGFEGDTLASALLAAGVRFMARSIRRRRPRGVFAVGASEPNALIIVGEGKSQDPVALATRVRLYDGLAARSARGWPNLRWDMGALLDFPYLRHLTAAGFYYKTFMWPRWEWFEPWIRRVAGPAYATLSHPDINAQKEFSSADAVVIGAGAAGLSAALELGKSGRSVILIDEHSELGGSLLWSGESIEGLAGPEWAAQHEALLLANPGVRVLRNTHAFGCYDHGTVGALEQRVTLPSSASDFAGPPLRLWRIRARQIVLATGAVERPLLFAGNDRPGIMLASAAQEYLGRFGVVIARRPVIVTNNDAAYPVAAALSAHSSGKVVILDCRIALTSAAAALPANVEVITGARVLETNARLLRHKGGRHRHGEVIALTFETGSSQRLLDCDALVVSGGWSPAIQLAAHTSIRPVYDPLLDSFKTPRSGSDFYAVGSAAGVWDAGLAAETAREAARAANGCGSPHASSSGLKSWPIAAAYPAPPKHREAEVWVDLQNDVTVRDLRVACDHGLHSIEHIKRFTTLGMGTDQGRTSAINGMHAVGAILGRAASEIGVTTYRPPLAPVSLAAFAGTARGDAFIPRRRLPAAAAHERAEAIFEEFSSWQRPEFYSVNGLEREAAVRLECMAVRQGVGLFDGSPMGKLEIHGPDSAEFLNQFYVNDVLSLNVGRVRYGLMLNDHGIILDDGVFARRGSTSYLVSPTSGNSRRVHNWFERWRQLEWPNERVAIADVTEQWAVLTLAGPLAREVFRRLQLCKVLRAASLPHMSFLEGSIAGIDCRIWRVSYTGESQFEINVPSDRGEWLWSEILTVGAKLGIRPVGLEAWLRLRIDKGYLHVGTETDGRTTPDDVGFGRIAGAKRAHYIGQRSLQRIDMRRRDRLQLIGLLTEDPNAVLPEGTHILAKESTCDRSTSGLRGQHSIGHVTSSCMSVAAGRSVALALLKGGRAQIGTWVTTFCANSIKPARVVSPMFYDAAGKRLHD